MKKITKKYLPLFLAIVMVFLSVPTSVTALDITSKSTNNITDISASMQDEVIPNDEYIADGSQTKIIEITALRGENVKHFQLPDGIMQAIAFPTAIHEKDAAGEWQLIDSSVSLKTVRGAEVYTTRDGVSSFASSVTSNAPLFTISENGYSIAVSLDNSTNHDLIHATDTVKRANVSSAEPTKTIEWQSVEDAISSTISKSTIRYESVYPYTDIEYIVSQNAVKENIVIKSAESAAIYRFKYQMTGLIAVLNDNGSISLLDEKTKKLEYEIPSPYMYDANGDISRNVYYTLSEVAAGTYIISVIADEEWLSDEKRSYPVVIDPSISSSRAVWDTFVNSADPDETYGDWGVWVGPSYTGLARNNMPTLPSGATITSGKLHVYYYYQSGVTGSRTIGAYKMTKTWDEMNDSYNTLKNSYGSSLGISTTLLSTATATASSGITSSNPRMITFDVTSAVSSWYNGSANYGIALKHYSGTPQATNGANTGTIIINYETYSDYRMYYTITYKIPNGVYAIEKAETDVYVKNNTLDELAWVFQDPFESPPLSELNKDYMFKITYRPATDDYVIRSMSNNEIIIYPSVYNNAPVSGKVMVAGAPATDSNISTAYTWKMTTTSDGYDYIWYKENGTTYYMCSTSNEGDGPILGFTTNQYGAGTKWNFHKYSGDAIDGITRIDFDSIIFPGQTYTYKACMYSSTIGRNGPVAFSVTNMDGSVTDKATINSSTGKFVAQKAGKVKVCITYPGAPWIWWKIVYIPKVVEISCYNNGGYWDVPNSSTTTTVECNDAAQVEHSVWCLIYQNNGYFTIRNYSTGYYLVNSGNTLKHQQMTSSITNSMQWKLIEQSDGSFKIASKINENYLITESNAVHGLADPNITLSSTDEGSRQKWHITIKEFTVAIDNYYDYSFQMRMDNSLTVTTNTLEIVTDRQERINDYLYSEYGIYVVNNTPSRRTSYADMCHGVNNISATAIEQICTHGTCDGRHGLCTHILNGTGSCNSECSSAFHHNNSLKIHTWYANELKNPAADINILWTGHKNCSDEYVPWSGGTHITATLYNSTDTRYWDYTAFHETGHSLGARGDNTCTNTSCVMSYSTSWNTYFSLLNSPGDNLFCDVCESQIRVNIHNKHY